MALSEKEVRKLMESDAYINKNNKNHKKVNREVQQGWENLYPDDDRNENPSNYYVWRTKGDDRVRSTHAAREGEVFSWSEPPEGGHPGEDYNCRCWAERYVPPKDVNERKEKTLEIDTTNSTTRSHVVNLLERNKENSDDYLLFDGFRLTWYRNNKPLKSWKAMSGNKNYQDKKYTGLKNLGPLPEGTWNVNQDKYQNYDETQTAIIQNIKNYLGGGQWKGGKPTWGNHRVWLEPDKETKTKGRTDLSIHGGWTFGSAGCIDLADGIDDFADMYQKYGKNIKLKVKYAPNFGK